MKRELIELARQALGGSLPMLELRGMDAQARAGGDIDFLVPSGRAREACLRLADAARTRGWHLLAFRDIGYLAQIVLVRLGANDEAIKVDFFSGFAWYGVGSDVVSREFFEMVGHLEGKPESGARLAAAATFVQKCLIAGRLSERDLVRVRAGGADKEYLLEVARHLGLPLSPRDIESDGVSGIRQWRLRAASAGVRTWLGFVSWFPRVAVAHVRFKLGLGSQAGAVMGLSGLDGSGKSTQLARLLAAYKSAGGEQPSQVHLLPAWIPMPHKLVRRKQTESNYLKPYAEAPVKSRTSGVLRLCYYLTAFVLAKAWMQLCVLRGQVVLMDRSFVDFAADVARARIPDFRLPGWLVRFCAPRGSLLFLDASPEAVVRRKGELTLEKAADLRARYLRVIEVLDGNVVSAEESPDTVFGHVLERIDAVYRARLTSVAEK